MEQSTQPTVNHNPLVKHFRQPAIYLKLPSGGQYWPEGSIELPLHGEIPILPMSTKDEITLKTPDALMNGQGVVNVIESCCPSIKDAWKTPSIDVDALIIAIRIASYGNAMDVESACPKCNEANEYSIDLGTVLSNITPSTYGGKVSADELKIKLRPQAYFNANKSNMIAFEEQQILRTLAQVEDNPEEAKKAFDQQLAKLINVNISMLATSTDYIETPDGQIVTDPAYIEEFYNNCNSGVIKAVRTQLTEFNNASGIKPVGVKCNHCEHNFEIGIMFDYSSFFGKGS
jgi:hypothetical protein